MRFSGEQGMSIQSRLLAAVLVIPLHNGLSKCLTDFYSTSRFVDFILKRTQRWLMEQSGSAITGPDDIARQVRIFA